MEKCIKCGGTLPADAKLCPYCGNPVSYYEEKMQPVPPASKKEGRRRTILTVVIAVLSVLLIASLAFAITLWTAAPAASPKLGVSPTSLDYGTLQVGSQSSQVLTLNNSGKQALDWKADKGNANWLTLDLSAGQIPSGGSQTINVRADTTLLTAGQYSASINFSSNGGTASVSAVLTVASGPVTPGVPVISGISPTSGPASGGTTVTIRGSGFTGATEVLFGTATSTFTVNSDTQITAVSPGGSGIVHVTVITPKGTATPSNADQFTYQGAPPAVTIPTIASISPTAGPVTGKTTVIIRGSNFTGVTKVLFGTVPASFTLNSSTQITAVSPSGSGTVHVTITTSQGTSATSNADRFTYMPVPTVTGISPTAGPIAGKTSVIIKGTGFTGATKVLFGTTAASFTLNSSTQITAVSPAGSGTIDVKVITPGGTSATSTVDRFTYMSVPSVTGISPTSGPATGGTSVKITGSNFTGATKVLFGTVAASNFTVNSNGTQITATSPANPAGTVDVRVITPGGTSATSAVDKFTYVAIPIVTGVSPTSGPLAGGTPVTIKGTGFTGASKVLFGTVAASNFLVNSDGTQITTYSPASAAGTVHVMVTTPKGTNTASTADQFTYLPVPTVTSISPLSGPVAGGTNVTIKGTDFTGVSKVLFGSTASIFTVNSSTQITAISPPSSAGTVDVTVITPGGTSATGTADRFTYLPVPTVTGISTHSGPAAGGTFVTITGTGFTADSQVRFGSVAASNFTVVNATQITAFSPAGSGTVHVTVTTPGGTSATSAADQFTYVPVPTVSSVSPNTGLAAGGTTVTIKGSGFTDANKVMFGSVAASSFTVNSDGTQITVTSPASVAGTVHVTVTTPIGGTSATTNADLFQYT